MGDVVPSLGLMKGVMLCNRPHGFEAALSAPLGPLGPFRVGVVSEMVHPKGNNRQIFEKNEEFISSPKDSTLTERNKQYLQNLAEERVALEIDAADRQRLAEEKRRKVAEQAQAFRDLVRGRGTSSEGGDDAAAAAYEEAFTTSPPSLPSIADATTSEKPRVRSSSKGATSSAPRKLLPAIASDAASAEVDDSLSRDFAAMSTATEKRDTNVHSSSSSNTASSSVGRAINEDDTEGDDLRRRLRELEEVAAQAQARVLELEAAAAAATSGGAKKKKKKGGATKGGKKKRKGGKGAAEGEGGAMASILSAIGNEEVTASTSAAAAAAAAAEKSLKESQAAEKAVGLKKSDNHAASSSSSALTTAGKVNTKVGEDAAAAGAALPSSSATLGRARFPALGKSAQDVDSDDANAGSDGEDDDDDEDDEDENDGMDTLGSFSTIRTLRPLRVHAGDDAGSIASSILSSTSLRSVHSKRSMLQLVEKHMAKEQERINAAVAAGLTDDALPPMALLAASGGTAPPRMAITSPSGNAKPRR